MDEEKKPTRELMPYMRARTTGGGCLICFEGFETLDACKEKIAFIREEHPDYPEQFVVHIPHLGDATC